MKTISVFALLITAPISSPFSPQVVFWNVGQGLFTTVITSQHCYHFDFGGERFPHEALPACASHKNFLFLSHEDLDHYSFIFKFRYQFKSLCIFKKTIKPRIPEVPICQSLPSTIHALYQPQDFKGTNSNSFIFSFKNQFLFTGDSTKSSENFWAHQISPSTRYWTLPHHGSNTSSSLQLLKNIPANAIGIVSARKSKYGHPHPKVIGRLKKYKRSYLKTEDWGNIRILFREGSFLN